MTRRKHRRTLVPIMMLALAVAAADPQPAQAAPKGFSQQLCEDLGYEWNERGCEGCTDWSGHGVKPGAKQTSCYSKGPPPREGPCHCNGRTGKWDFDQAALTQPAPPRTGPAVTPQGATAPLPLLTPQGPGAPLPLRKAP